MLVTEVDAIDDDDGDVDDDVDDSMILKAQFGGETVLILLLDVEEIDDIEESNVYSLSCESPASFNDVFIQPPTLFAKATNSFWTNDNEDLLPWPLFLLL